MKRSGRRGPGTLSGGVRIDLETAAREQYQAARRVLQPLMAAQALLQRQAKQGDGDAAAQALMAGGKIHGAVEAIAALCLPPVAEQLVREAQQVLQGQRDPATWREVPVATGHRPGNVVQFPKGGEQQQ